MNPRVLVIEDNPFNAELMVYLLQSFGYCAATAGDGESGVAAARAEPPDLVLCDVQLPGIDGFEVVERLRGLESMRGVPLIAVTALAMVGDHDRVLRRGFDGYVSKPIDPQGFIAEIRRLVPENQPQPPSAPSPLAQGGTARRCFLATILALDDTHLNLELKRGLLEPHGYEVLTADTMAQALQLARERLPDLIISDIGMREGDGFEFIRALKAEPQLKDIPVMFLSSTHWDEESRARGLALGAERYLRRPMDSHLLLSEIRALLHR